MLAFAAPLCAAPADAQHSRDRILFGAGLYDGFHRKDETLDLRFEYRWGWSLWRLKPWAGIEATGDGALYGVAGLLADLELAPGWMFTPGAGAGFYHKGKGKDLGHSVEFRTQIEFAYRFAPDTRLAIALSHISNAGIGETNPGIDILTVYYSIPLARRSGDGMREPPS